ncbi:MAG: demethoxyubiquinone hydroxylase family protein, partial [Pseudomonadota bacterium]|nr:demethoxyubiquinone hydroxylase family protein [Pseudomonadota bacterium]
MTWKPGDRPAATDAMIRVDQAGEYGATRIYAGQLAIMGQRSPMARKISAMALQEERHRAFFDRM